MQTYGLTIHVKEITSKYAHSKNKSYNAIWKYSYRQYSRLRIKNEIKYLYSMKQSLTLQIYNSELHSLNFFGKYWHHIKELM